jgi:hypothetical protein
MSDDSNTAGVNTSRRSLLATVAGTAAVGGTASAAASAESGGTAGRHLRERRQILEARNDLEAEYDSRNLREIVQDSTASIRKTLVDRGVLESPELSQFTLAVENAARVDPARFTAIRNHVGFATTYEKDASKATAHLFVATQAGSQQVHLHVLPEVDEAYSVVVRSPNDETGTQSVGTEAECESCTIDCNHAVYGAIVFGVNPPTDCTDVTWECTREPTCDECSGQDKCSSGWF